MLNTSDNHWRLSVDDYQPDGFTETRLNFSALPNEGMNRQLATNCIPYDASYFSCSIAGIHTQFQQRQFF